MKLAPIAAQKSESAIGTCENWTIGPRFRLVRTFDLAPPSGRVALGGRFPGLKPSGWDRGRDKVDFAPPSEPDGQISWIRLSSWWLLSRRSACRSVCLS